MAGPEIRNSFSVGSVYLALPRHWQSLHDVQRGLSKKTSLCHGCCHCKKLRKLVTVLEWFHALCSEKFLQWEQGDGKDSTCRTFPGQPKAAALQLVASWLPMKTDAFQRHNASNMLDLRYGESIFQAWYQKNTYWRGSLGCVFWGLRPTKPMKSTCYTRICLMFTKWNIPSNAFTWKPCRKAWSKHAEAPVKKLSGKCHRLQKTWYTMKSKCYTRIFWCSNWESSFRLVHLKTRRPCKRKTKH